MTIAFVNLKDVNSGNKYNIKFILSNRASNSQYFDAEIVQIAVK